MMRLLCERKKCFSNIRSKSINITKRLKFGMIDLLNCVTQYSNGYKVFGNHSISVLANFCFLRNDGRPVENFEIVWIGVVPVHVIVPNG